MLAKWNAYMSSLLEFSVFESQVKYGDRTFQVTEYAFDDITIWENLTITWTVPSTVNYGFLFQLFAPSPHLPVYPKLRNSLWCISLPSEIPDKIFSRASENKIRLLRSNSNGV
ncbi:hypothetical protein H2248_001350 [Termitomyces sp. 'cryptogamus']|nr:hypothetical protein H2248_001350 [Termitomyces sp. 'cryptogamus']